MAQAPLRLLGCRDGHGRNQEALTDDHPSAANHSAPEREIFNRLLLALPRGSLERLMPNFEPVALKPRQVIHQAGASIEHLHFINRGLVSLVKSMDDGRTVEVGATGTDGVVGLFAIHGVARAVGETVVHAPGTAIRIEVSHVRQEIDRTESVRQLFERLTQIAIGDLAQMAACNRLHSLEERCCRWLLVVHDSARSDSFPMTHEHLALLLGVQRSGLSISANLLRRAGLIRYTSGFVTITDRTGLEAAACECYATMRAQVEELFRQ